MRGRENKGEEGMNKIKERRTEKRKRERMRERVKEIKNKNISKRGK